LAARRAALLAGLSSQNFLRNAAELEKWIAERMQQTNDGNGNDTANLEVVLFICHKCFEYIFIQCIQIKSFHSKSQRTLNQSHEAKFWGLLLSKNMLTCSLPVYEYIAL